MENDPITLNTFKAKSPIRDQSLYLAIAAGVGAWNETGNAWMMIATIAAWLVTHGYIRSRGVEAAGRFAASLESEPTYHASALMMLPDPDDDSHIGGRDE